MKRLILFLLMLCLLMGCTPTSVELEVATAVPVTITKTTVFTPTSPLTNTTQPSPTSTFIPTEPPPTKNPRVTPTIEASQTYTVSSNGVQFVIDSRLAPFITVVEQSEEELQYRSFLFAPGGYCHDVGCVTVYDVEYFRANISDIVDDFAASLEIADSTYIPTWGAAILIQAQEKIVTFDNGTGRRAIVMRGQNSFWAHNDAIVYDYHGLTVDGRYYINITIPIDAPIFMGGDNTDPNLLIPRPTPDPAASPGDEIVQMVEYNTTVESQLANLSAATFVPDLALLDAFVASLIITE